MAPLNPAPLEPELLDLAEAITAAVRRSMPGGSVTDSAPSGLRDLTEFVVVTINQYAPVLNHAQRQSLLGTVLARVRNDDLIDRLLLDPNINEIAVNGGRSVWVDRDGQMQQVGTLSTNEVELFVERTIAPLGLRFDRTSPVLDARLPGGQRLCAVLAPLAVDGTCLSVRQFSLQHLRLDAFAEPPVCDLLRRLHAARANIVVSGATSSGKTTLLNALGSLCEPHERIITIEDAAELRLRSPHVVRLEARPATPDGVPAITVRDLLRAALRLRPDRLLIGEVRGPEAYDMVQALNTGHDGSLSTVHANSPVDALRRITSLAVLAAPGHLPAFVEDQVRSSIDVVVQVQRLPSGQRRVATIEEVTPPGVSGPGTTVLANHHDVTGEPRRSLERAVRP